MTHDFLQLSFMFWFSEECEKIAVNFIDFLRSKFFLINLGIYTNEILYIFKI